MAGAAVHVVEDAADAQRRGVCAVHRGRSLLHSRQAKCGNRSGDEENSNVDQPFDLLIADDGFGSRDIHRHLRCGRAERLQHTKIWAADCADDADGPHIRVIRAIRG